MRQFTKKVGEILFRDGPMLVASSLFVILSIVALDVFPPE